MTYPSRNSRISAGLGSSSSFTSSASASSSSMISLHRSMHSSQMYTPGPAMSFLTCFWDFAQKLHLTRSPPSPNFATACPFPFRVAPGQTLGCADRREGGSLPRGDDLVDQAVLDGLVRGHHEVAVRVLGDLVNLLPGVRGHHLVEQVAHPQDLAGLDLDVRRLPADAAPGLVQHDPRVRQREALALGARRELHRAR